MKLLACSLAIFTSTGACSQTPRTVPVAGSATVTIPAPVPGPTPPATPPSAAPDVVVLSAGKFHWSGNFNYGGSVEKDAVLDLQGVRSSSFTATALPSGGGGWLPYRSTFFNTTGYGYLQLTLKPTREGQTWKVTQPENAGDIAVPGSTEAIVEQFGPAPIVGQYGVYRIPLGVGGLNLPIGVTFWKFGLQDQMPYGPHPENAKGNVFYISDARFTAN
jgi:hypothetical protein